MNSVKQSIEIRFSFICRSTHQYKNGESPIIILRVSYRGERRDIFTGLTCDRDFWIPGIGRVDENFNAASTINKNLGEIHYKAKEHFDALRYSGNDFTIDELVSKIKGVEPPPVTLLEYCELKLKEYEDCIDIDLCRTTYYKYNRTTKYLKDFLSERRKVKNIAVGSVDEEFLRQFFLYLRKEKKNSNNSSVVLMFCLKGILKIPLKNGTIKTNPFDYFPLSRTNVHRDYLEIEDIKKLQEVEGLTETEERYRDMFLFVCYTGLAYADIKGLRSSNIFTDPDGSKCIRDAREKSDVAAIIPLLGVAEKILLKYSPTGNCSDFVWKVPANQTINRSLKVIAKKAGVTKPIFMHLGRHTFATTVTLSHGVPIESVSKMLGHTTLKHTHIYAKIVATKVKADMHKIAGIFSR